MRVGVGAAELIYKQCIAYRRVGRSFGTLDDFDETTVCGTSTAAGNRPRHDGGTGVRCKMNHLRTGILILALACEAERHGAGLRIRLGENAGRILHGCLGTNVAIDPFHGAAFTHVGTLRHQIVNVVRPVLHGGVAHAGMRLDENLHHTGMQRIGRVDRCGAAFHIMHVRSLVGNDQRALELTHIRRIDTEVCLQRNIDMHTLRHVDERSARPCGGVQCREFVVVARNALAEILLDDFRILLHRGVGIDENHALVFKILLD